MINHPILFSFIALIALLSPLNTISQEGQLMHTGVEDLDLVRNQVIVTATNDQNIRSRKAILNRFHHFLVEHGIDMTSFDSLANLLVDAQNENPNSHSLLDHGFQQLEDIFANPNYIPEIKGSANNASKTQTDWPVYHGTDGSQSGYSPDSGPSEGKVVWRFPKANGWTVQPNVSGDEVFVSGVGADVIGYNLDAKTGSVKWKARFMSPSYYNTPGARYDPIVSPDNIAFRIGARYHPFDRSTGNYSSMNSEGDTEILKLKKSVSLMDVSKNVTIWHYQLTDGLVTEDPCVTDEHVFLSTSKGEVICLDKSSGSVTWKINIPNEPRGKISQTPEIIYVTSVDRTIYAINKKTGEIHWEKQFDPKFNQAYEYFSPFEVDSDRIYFGTAAGYLYCLNQSNGQVVWKYELGEWIRSKPLKKGNKIYVASLAGNIHSILVRTPKPETEWSYPIGDHAFTADLTSSDHGLLASNEHAILYNIDFSSGEIKWKHSMLDGIWKDDKFYATEKQSGQQSSPTIVNGTLYIAGPDGFVNAVNTETGNEIWRFETKSSISPSPTVAEGKVFVGQTYDSFGKYFALDAQSGEPVWTSEEFGSVWISAAYENGRIFFGNMDGYFFCVDPTTGDKIWEYNTIINTPNASRPLNDRSGGHGWPPGVYCNPIAEDGVVYTGSWSGYYFAFDQATGKLLWRTKTQPEGWHGGGLPDSAAPVLHKDHIYVQKAGAIIAAINKFSGEIDWQWSAPPGFLQNGTVAAKDDMIFGSVVRRVTDLSYHASVIAFNDVANGSEKVWTYRGGGGLTAPVLTRDKIIFGSSSDPFLTCLNPANGEVIWRLNVGGIMLESVPSIYGNKVFALIKNGYLYAIE